MRGSGGGSCCGVLVSNCLRNKEHVLKNYCSKTKIYSWTEKWFVMFTSINEKLICSVKYGQWEKWPKRPRLVQTRCPNQAV
jgi:hypothetical protein